jgi:hypothetical protein
LRPSAARAPKPRTAGRAHSAAKAASRRTSAIAPTANGAYVGGAFATAGGVAVNHPTADAALNFWLRFFPGVVDKNIEYYEMNRSELMLGFHLYFHRR